jgi:transcriptional regulator with XRE-family HTH domain
VNDAPSAPPERLQLVGHEALAAHMKLARQTVRGLASALGVNRCTVDRLRRGAQKTVEADVARRIEKEVGVPAGALFVAPQTTSDQRSEEGRESMEVSAA